MAVGVISHASNDACYAGYSLFLVNTTFVFFVMTGVEEAMGVENSGVLYALWSYPAQAADELSFKEGDMVTILQKPEGSPWWWASLCGREGLVPNNYFGVRCQFLINSVAFTDIFDTVQFIVKKNNMIMNGFFQLFPKVRPKSLC